MPVAKIGPKHQITIPKEVFDSLCRNPRRKTRHEEPHSFSHLNAADKKNHLPSGCHAAPFGLFTVIKVTMIKAALGNNAIGYHNFFQSVKEFPPDRI